MSNQMMQFDGPEGQEQKYSPDPDPRYINRDPREQGQQEPLLYDGYRGQTGQPVYGEKLRPRPQKKRVQWWVPLLVTLLVLMLPMMGYLFASHSVTVMQPNMKDGGQSQNYKFTQNNTQGRTLVIHDNNGTVQIHSGDSGSNAVVVQTNSNGPHFGDRGDNGNGIQVDPSLNDPNSTASSVTISAQSPSGPFSSVDMEVTVPQGMNVQVVDSSGQVELNNFTGNADIEDISGSITANNVTGQVVLSAQSGSISLGNSKLSGTSILTSDSGSIQFDGSITQSGTYSFSSTSGSVDVRLPSNSSFHLNASSNSGTVNNEFNANDVGAQPRPALTIHSDSGSVDIQKN